MLSLVQGEINTASEQRAFVFAVSFIIIFSVLVASVPTGLLGLGETPDMVTALDPSIITGFSVSETYNKSDFSLVGVIYQYLYDLGSRTWLCQQYSGAFTLGAKVFIGGVLWLGQLDSCNFISSDGVDRSYILTFTEIDTDADDGVIRYTLQYVGTGASAGGFVVYWNTTTYSDSSAAWTGGGLYLLHGMGVEETANADIGALLISLLLLQLPEVPVLINVLLVVPIWASIIFVLWYVIKEMIPFV